MFPFLAEEDEELRSLKPIDHKFQKARCWPDFLFLSIQTALQNLREIFSILVPLVNVVLSYQVEYLSKHDTQKDLKFSRCFYPATAKCLFEHNVLYGKLKTAVLPGVHVSFVDCACFSS